MTRAIVFAAVKAAAFATVVLGCALVIRPVSYGTAVDAYVLVLGAIAALAFVRFTRAASGGTGARSQLEAALSRRPPPAQGTRELERMEREVDLAVANAFYLHYRLRPLVRRIAEHRLAVRRGVALDSSAGQAALPEDDRELLRPDRPEPHDFNGPGIPLPRLRSLVTTLERL